MRKQLIVLVSLFAAAAMILTGCGPAAAPATQAPVVQVQTVVQQVVVTATPGPVKAPEADPETLGHLPGCPE